MQFKRAFSLLCSAAIVARSWASTASISSYPLAVRNPYLSAWLPGNVASDAPTAEPEFWYGQTLYWPVFARVAGTTYYLFSEVNGVSNAKAATQTGIEFTATHTIITFTAGSATVTLDFFSPVSPSNYVRQSLPYSYLTVSVTSSAAQDVQIFSGIDDSWSGFSGSLSASVETGSDGESVYWDVSDPSQTLYEEVDQMAAWGSIIFGSKPATGSTMTYMYNTRSTVQQDFVSSGTLDNTATAYGADYTFGISHDFGSTTSASATFAVGYDRAHALTFLGASYSGYYMSEYPTPATALPAFLADYESAYAESVSFDAQVVAAGADFSPFAADYTVLLEQSVRQTYGAMDLVIPTSTYNTSSVLVFLKEISSDGDVSTIDVIFPTFPALYAISPEWIRLLLEPYLIYLNTGDWPEKYIPHDLGVYPQASGHNDGGGEAIYVEATAPLFTLLYAYTKATGTSNAWLDTYKEKLFVAGDWTVANGLYPADQLSTVDAISASANQTGLGICSAVGLKALGALFGLSNYTTYGESFANTIYTEGLGLNSVSSPTHFTYNYDFPDSWVTAFHLYPDALLGLSTFPEEAHVMQADWYAQKYADLASVSGGTLYAVPGDGYSVDFMISEWALWVAATSREYASTYGVGTLAVDAMYKFVTNGLNPVPMPTKFIVSGTTDIGDYVNNKARSTVGSVWSFVALTGTW
ncbi:hypothetical protein BD289DRAFT_468362 [Coniella lustricola]|uniref:Glutaminase n=1 Tax=Coniella lustricola TaxID=2025994 RepID=A0A2T3A2M6_9PEZI|nr:hypothetical protein BD289DRAFT_468362 [Coniella lustricola]